MEADLITIYRDAWNQNAEEWDSQDADKAAKSLKQKGFTVEVLEVAPDPNFSVVASTDSELEAVFDLG